jgi:hypothetical protein
LAQLAALLLELLVHHRDADQLDDPLLQEGSLVSFPSQRICQGTTGSFWNLLEQVFGC